MAEHEWVYLGENRSQYGLAHDLRCGRCGTEALRTSTNCVYVLSRTRPAEAVSPDCDVQAVRTVLGS